jgi:hypothetical protein
VTDGGAPLVALVDESGFRARFPAESVRLAKRREGWRAAADAAGVVAVFADLERPDLPALEAELNAVIEGRASAVR